jgi:hypothetical protein
MSLYLMDGITKTDEKRGCWLGREELTVAMQHDLR